MSSTQASAANLLLRALSQADFALLEPHLKHEELTLKDPIFRPNERVERVYFFENGVSSIVSEQEGGDQVEIGLFGRERMSGTAVIVGAEQSPHASMVQIGNPTAHSIAADRLVQACEASSSLGRVFTRYVQSCCVQAALTASSNAHYALPERLARWILMCHDRGEGDRMEITHEFLSMMLAVRRSDVTVTPHLLSAHFGHQQSGLKRVLR